ncbi:MAG: HAMP domain-containing histidine kinase [Planctomycetes bacterium]|nr:HAMP domain-containing histidine kinase [Planctomycetota bacterium]
MTRAVARHLPAALFLIVPLIVLAWAGSSELGRQEERAARALRTQASARLQDVARRARDSATRVADAAFERLTAALLAADGRELLDLARELRARDDVLGFPIVLDGDAELLFPAGATSDLAGLPFLDRAGDPRLVTAERLEVLGDAVGARALYEEVIAGAPSRDPGPRRRGFGSREAALLRAHFELAGLLRRAGDAAGAIVHYRAAAAAATFDAARGSERTARRATSLLCSTALAELELEEHGDAARSRALLLDIALGVHDDVPRDLVAAADARLTATLPPSDEHGALLARTAALSSVRSVGHAFAEGYAGFLREAVRRRIRRAADGERRVDVVDPAPVGGVLLLLERPPPAVRDALQRRLPDAEWIGLQLDLAALLDDAVRLPENVAPTFRIERRDGSGDDWLGDERSGTALDATLATEVGPFGTVLAARPIDPAAALDESRRRGTRRVLLALALVAAAAGGAVLLLRSVGRETELLRTRVALVSRVSHELRTPLALIRMYAETLGRGRAADAAQRAHFADVIVRETDGLSRIVERILDFSAKESGNLRYRPEPVDLAERLAATVAAYCPHVQTRGASLESELTAGLSAAVDPAGFDNAVVNLIENAVKYTPEDAPDRRVEVALLAVGADRVAVEVRDRGIGIPEPERELVFRGFHRASNAGEIRGAGLGLSLVRHFATAHGGTATASPRPGGGTVVRVELPRLVDTAPRRTGPEP